MSKEITNETEHIRRQLVKDELAAFEQTLLTFDAKSLSRRERQFLTKMLRVADVVDAICFLQRDPQTLEYREEIRLSGTSDDQALFERNRGPWCESVRNPLCNAHPSLPAKREAWHHWPEGMNEATLKLFSETKNKDELLSPFTVVRFDAKGNYIGIPYASWPLIREKLESLSQEMTAAIKYADTPSMKKFLRSRARAFLHRDPYPYDASDIDWIKIKSKWELTIGAYETYRDPLNVKAMFGMLIAQEDPKVTKELEQYKRHLQSMEDLLAKELGGNLYKRRKLDKGIEIRAVQVIRAAGDYRYAYGSTAAYHLPNQGAAIDAGLSKKVMLINHMTVRYDQRKKQAEIAIVPHQAKLVDDHSAIMNTTLHELAHGLGSYHTMPITVKGKKTTVRESLGIRDTLMEEVKADSLGVWFLPYLHAQGLVNDEELKRRYVAYLLWTITMLQRPLDNTYTQVAAIELGNLLQEGAVVYHPKQNQYEIRFEKMDSAIDKLARRVTRIQFSGDRKGADKLLNDFVELKDGKPIKFAKFLDEPNTKLKEAFKKANLRVQSLAYEIKGV